MHPGFSAGDSYLLLLYVPNRPKSFELIVQTQGDETTEDKWLQ